MSEPSTRLVADDYSYTLPDHWIMEKAEITSHFPILHEAYVSRVVGILKDTVARTVIEVGCGDGWNCHKLVQAGLNVVGIDWSRNGIAYARILVPGAQFYCGDLRDPAFLEKFPQPFDAAVFIEVIEHIPPEDCVNVLRNISATLKIGGILVLTTPSVNLPNTNPQHYRHFDEPTLRTLISEAGGLEIVSVEGYGDVPFETMMYRKLRWFQNRYYTIKPIAGKLLDGYRQYCLDRPLNRCAGFIMKIKKISS
jgi:2-polyprenyl-3-methyl-5-hydroxy-6-metoxy-1,4-benzoquinol methylase